MATPEAVKTEAERRYDWAREIYAAIQLLLRSVHVDALAREVLDIKFQVKGGGFTYEEVFIAGRSDTWAEFAENFAAFQQLEQAESSDDVPPKPSQILPFTFDPRAGRLTSCEGGCLEGCLHLTGLLDPPDDEGPDQRTLEFLEAAGE